MTWHLTFLFISFITITNKLLLFALFFFQRKNKKFNRLLAAIIGSAIPMMLSNLLNYLHATDYVALVFVAAAFSMLYYPLCILLFHESLKIPLKKGWKFKVYMWGPVFYYLLLTVWYMFFLGEPAKEDFIQSCIAYRWDNEIIQAINIPITLTFLGHIIYFLFFIRKAKNLTKKFEKGHMIKKRYKFVRTFVISLISIAILLLILGFMNFGNEFVDMIIVPMSSNILTILIVFFAFDGRLVYEEEPAFQLIEKNHGKGTLTPKKGVLLAGKKRELKQKIDAFFESSEAFCEHDFSLQKLAELLHVPPHHLSFVINSEHGQSFSDLLGYHRVKKAKTMIESDAFKQLTIEGIGQSVGYKSKSTFFSHFKKITGKTPLDFKKGGAIS